jgi:homoserine O-succinyltransferase
VDVFTRQPPGLSHFLFLQGHPEYDPDTLGRDYLREMGLFLRGECAESPPMPQHYFDRATEERLQAIAGRSEADLPDYVELVARALPRWNWHANSVRLFANWLTLVAAAKTRQAPRRVQDRRRVS